jgi:hypothetical protein
MTPNGVNAFANTNLVDTFALLGDLRHVSVYSRTNADGNFVDMGAYGSSTYGTFINPRASNLYYGLLGVYPGATYQVGSNTDSRGFFLFSRGTANTFSSGYKNGVLVGNRNSSPQTTGLNIYIGAWNFDNTAGAFSPRQLCFASIGKTVVTTQSQFATIVNAFQTSLGRNTY